MIGSREVVLMRYIVAGVVFLVKMPRLLAERFVDGDFACYLKRRQNQSPLGSPGLLI